MLLIKKIVCLFCFIFAFKECFFMDLRDMLVWLDVISKWQHLTNLENMAQPYSQVPKFLHFYLLWYSCFAVNVTWHYVLTPVKITMLPLSTFGLATATFKYVIIFMTCNIPDSDNLLSQILQLRIYKRILWFYSSLT